jgi:hypothetical protein
MYLSEKEVTLNLTSRPLRLVYLVGNREEFQNAVNLYTHIWGGLTNAILPIHEDDLDIDSLKNKIILINPDFIFISTTNIYEAIYTNLKEILPVIIINIDTEKIQKHIEGTELINLPHYSARSRHFTAKLSHIVSVLQEIYANPLPDSHIWGIEEGNSLDFELSIQYGKISTMYRKYLTEHLAANFLRLPQNFEELVKSSLLLASSYNTICLTEIKIGKKQPLDNPIQLRMNCSSLLTIFLGDDQDIDIAAAYWNSRSFGLQNTNKLYLPKSEVLNNIERLTALILECMPSTAEILIVINTDLREAKKIAEQVYQAFVIVVPHFRIEVIYQNFNLIFFRGQAYSGNPINTTYIKFEDGSVRFSPPVPIGHQNREFLFGWEAEVRLASSRRLLLPINKSSAVFLSNSQHQIEWADKNPDRSELKGLSTRASSKGITGTISYKNDCCLYIPTDKMVISQRFKDAGLKIEINEHTRYAQGFIKRFGGFRKTIAFVKNNGLGICKALERRTENNNRQVQQGGYKIDHIYQWLNNIGIKDQDSKKKFVLKHLPVLLSVGLVRRGYNLSCSHCNLTTWYPIERVQEFIDCVGCAESFQIPVEKIDFTYKLNELASHFLRSGGDAVLMTAAVLYQLMPYSWMQFGGNIHRRHKKASFAEIDVIGLEADTLVLAESKSYSQIKEQHIEQIEESLKKTIEVAKLVNAQIVLLSITTSSSNSELHTLHTVVSEISHEAKDSGIGVHLAINGKLHPWGKEGKSELYQWMNIVDQLRVDEETPEEQLLSVVVGELPSQGFLSSKPLLDDEVMQRWRLELGVNQASP